MGQSYVSTYFSPNRGAADQIIGFIDRCNETIDAAIYALTHDGVASALIRAHLRGVKIRILVDRLQAGSQYADDERLEEAGIPILRDTQAGSMHWKTIIGDAMAVGTGSFNWTKSADLRNAENFVIIRLKYVIQTFQREFNDLWAANAS
jgi:phosphatidylserine/phosphatidylglycerophosphate/cardiolipin synthase-like enzyme